MMKRCLVIVVFGFLCAEFVLAGDSISITAKKEPVRPSIVGIEHALSESMIAPPVKPSKFAFFRKSETGSLPVAIAVDLGDKVSLICDKNDPSGTLLEIKATDAEWAEIISEIHFIDKIKEVNRRIYSKVNDDFDFVFYVLNTPIDDEIKKQLGFFGLNSRVTNNVQGIGYGQLNLSSEWGTEGKLMSALFFPYYNAISAGPSLHEIGHCWSAFIFPTYEAGNKQYAGHWGISNADGQAGGFKYVRVIEENCDGTPEKTLYQASRHSEKNRDGSFKNGGFGINANNGNASPYSDIELYLMGLKSEQELRDANFQLDIYSGNEFNVNDLSKGYFYSTSKKSYTIDDIIKRNGKRIPDVANSQKQFKVLTVVITPENADKSFREVILRDINWLAGEMNDKTFSGLYNFRQATGGRGSLVVNNLKNSLKIPVPAENSVFNKYDVIITSRDQNSGENIRIETEQNASIAKVYPNPTDGKFTLEYEAQSEFYLISITNFKGNVLMRSIVVDRLIQLDINSYPEGVYFLTIIDGNQTITKKIVKN